jgi:hypothetical protein
MIVNRIRNNSDEEIEFITGDAMSVAESKLELRTSNKPDNINLALLKDWIDIEMIEKQSSSTKESEQPSSTSNVTYPSDTITSNSYTFPEEKVCTLFELLQYFISITYLWYCPWLYNSIYRV